jgi:hypothetical protein
VPRERDVMTRGFETPDAGAGRRRTSIRSIRRGAAPGSRVRGILDGRESALGEVVVRALVAGMGLLFTATRDGGAVGVHLYSGETRASDFCASPEDLDATLEALHERLEGRTGPGPELRALGRENGLGNG